MINIIFIHLLLIINIGSMHYLYQIQIQLLGFTLKAIKMIYINLLKKNFVKYFFSIE